MNLNIYDDLGFRTDKGCWISTPSHGYLKVLTSAVLISQCRPSTYSFSQGDYSYLEEDFDAGAYLRAIEDKERQIPVIYTDLFIEQYIGSQS